MQSETEKKILDLLEQQTQEIDNLKQEIAQLKKADNDSTQKKEIKLQHLTDESSEEYYELKHKDLEWQRDFEIDINRRTIKFATLYMLGIAAFCGLLAWFIGWVCKH